jgi:uncharacterized protein involved in exopolysaccharide biosynthesis
MTDADWTLEHLKAKFDATRDAANKLDARVSALRAALEDADKLDARVSALRAALEDAEIEKEAAWLDHQRVDIRLHLHRRLRSRPQIPGEDQ